MINFAAGAQVLLAVRPDADQEHVDREIAKYDQPLALDRAALARAGMASLSRNRCISGAFCSGTPNKNPRR
jgi:hypothetical protein